MEIPHFFYYLEMLGTIYIRLLQLTILPVIASNIIVGKAFNLQ